MPAIFARGELTSARPCPPGEDRRSPPDRAPPGPPIDPAERGGGGDPQGGGGDVQGFDRAVCGGCADADQGDE